ncbi:hypothetical protein [Microbacterium trichothecenolyticum]|uniref:hypothetical protein n=1 Tax=Microbacterium trichothecenolyticum TaxID=69370 RepID=UPI0027D9065D|nr:hypothetical protein [Microbacterium trichothecenolyticum]
MGRTIVVAMVAAARAAITMVLALGFWAAAPVVLGWSPTTVMTASMTPAIDAGDVVVAKPADRTQMVPGRVLLARDPDWPDRLRLHRLVEVTDDGSFITKGDANPSADTSPLHPDAALGIGVLRVPWVGLPIVWLRTGEIAPLAATAVGFLLCLSIALRRGEDEEGDDNAPPPVTTTAGDTPAVPTTRRARRAAGIVAAVALTSGLAATPAWAALGEDTWAFARVDAGRVTAPWAIACANNGNSGAVISWTYDGWQPRSFDLLVDGEVVAQNLSPSTRSTRVPTDRYYALLSSYRVTVRVNVAERWSAESSESVAIGGRLFILGRPYCR